MVQSSRNRRQDWRPNGWTGAKRLRCGSASRLRAGAAGRLPSSLGKPALATHPGRSMDDHVQQVSWLAARSSHRLPGPVAQWHVMRGIPLTVAGAARALNPVPFQSPFGELHVWPGGCPRRPVPSIRYWTADPPGRVPAARSGPHGRRATVRLRGCGSSRHNARPDDSRQRLRRTRTRCVCADGSGLLPQRCCWPIPLRRPRPRRR